MGKLENDSGSNKVMIVNGILKCNPSDFPVPMYVCSMEWWRCGAANTNKTNGAGHN